MASAGVPRAVSAQKGQTKGPSGTPTRFVSFFIVDAHRNEILLRYFGTPNDRSTQVNGQFVYPRFFYDRARVRRLPFKELFIQVTFAFACKRLRLHNRSDL